MHLRGFFAQLRRTLHIVKQIIWRKELEEYDDVADYTYFEKKYGQVLSLDVYFPQ